MSKNSKKKRIQIYLSEDQTEFLQKEKKKTGAPVSEIIRRCIDDYRLDCRRLQSGSKLL